MGSASLTTDAGGNKYGELRYKPYGETRYTWGNTPTDRRFTGQLEESGLGSLYDYGARMFSPVLGRFLSADTIVPSPGNPQSLNRYSYVLNSPLKYTDPTGHAGGSPNWCPDGICEPRHKEPPPLPSREEIKMPPWVKIGSIGSDKAGATFYTSPCKWGEPCINDIPAGGPSTAYVWRLARNQSLIVDQAIAEKFMPSIGGAIQGGLGDITLDSATGVAGLPYVSDIKNMLKDIHATNWTQVYRIIKENQWLDAVGHDYKVQPSTVVLVTNVVGNFGIFSDKFSVVFVIGSEGSAQHISIHSSYWDWGFTESLRNVFDYLVTVGEPQQR